MTDAREVARAAVLWAWSFRRGMVASGYNRGVAEPSIVTATHQSPAALTAAAIADRLTTMPTGSTMPTVPLFVELCAGTAALSLALHGGRHARPPVSRMGSKAGYASTILAVLGLRPGEGAARYLWCEPDAGCRLMLTAYTDAALRREAAAIIRSWADEEARALWTRLRDEGPVRCPPVDPREVARWAWIAQRSLFNGSAKGPCWVPANPVGGGHSRYAATSPAPAFDALPDLPAVITDDARPLEPADLPPGTIAYIDPSYVGTTGYADDLPRAAVVAIARRWAAAGAWVVISEAEPIAELVADGWHAVEITAGRVGQKRTFSKQQREWLTMSRAPAWRPSEQAALFGAPTAAPTAPNAT